MGETSESQPAQRKRVYLVAVHAGSASDYFFDDVPELTAFLNEQLGSVGQKKRVFVCSLDLSTQELFRAPGFTGTCNPRDVSLLRQDHGLLLVAMDEDGRAKWSSEVMNEATARKRAEELEKRGLADGRKPVAIIFQAAKASRWFYAEVRFRPDDQVHPDQLLLPPKRPANARIPGGPIIGYRCWRIRSRCSLTGQLMIDGDLESPELQFHRPVLISRYMESLWTSPQAQFNCAVNHAVPAPDHGCGLYAYRRLKNAEGEMYTRVESCTDYRNPSDITMVGIVSGHGDVLVHGDGFRAEEMHILGFVDTGEFPELRRQVAAGMEVPMIPLAEAEVFARSRGRIIKKADISPGPVERLARGVTRLLTPWRPSPPTYREGTSI